MVVGVAVVVVVVVGAPVVVVVVVGAPVVVVVVVGAAVVVVVSPGIEEGQVGDWPPPHPEPVCKHTKS